MSRKGWSRVLDRGVRWAVIVPALGTFLGGSLNVIEERTRLTVLGQASLLGLGLLLILVAMFILGSVHHPALESAVIVITAVLLIGFTVGRPDISQSLTWWPTSVTVLVLCWVVGFGGRFRWWIGSAAVVMFAGIRWWAADLGGHSPRMSAGDLVTTTQITLTVVLGVTAVDRVARRSDAAEEERAAALEAEATHSASALRARWVGRFLHDEVSHTLRAIALARGADRVPLRSLANRTVDRLATGALPEAAGPTLQPGDLLDRLKSLDGVNGVRVRVVGKAPALADEVVGALVAATAEALRNVARHAATDEALVRVRPARAGVVVAVIDHGGGVSAGVAPGIGITNSVIGRMDEVGGAARVRSNRMGTTVELRWSPDADAERIAETWQELTRELTPMVIPGVVAALTLGFLALPDVTNPVLATLSLMIFAAAGSWVVVHGVWLTPIRSYALLVTASVTSFAANVFALPPETQNGYYLFLAGGAASLLMLIAIQHRFWWSLLAVGVVWGAMAVLCAVRFGADTLTGALFGALTAPFVVLGILLPRAVLDRVVRRTLGARDQATLSRLRAESLQQQHGAEDARLHSIRTNVEPFLRAVADDQVDLADQDVHRQAHNLETYVRDLMRFGPAVDALGDSVHRIRQAGWRIELRISPEQRPRATAEAEALLAVLGSCEPGTGAAFLSAFGDVALVVRDPVPAQLRAWRSRMDIELEEGDQWCRMTVRTDPRPSAERRTPVGYVVQPVAGGR